MLILLLASLGLPLITAVLLLLFRGSMAADNARWIALAGAIVTMCSAFGLLSEYQRLPAKNDVAVSPVNPGFEYTYPWIQLKPGTSVEGQPATTGYSFSLQLGIDGISVVMILLTALLGISSILISWESIKERQAEFYASLLALQAGVTGVFCAFDLVLFYAFFEITLIPLFFLILVWGGAERRAAALKFFIYTFCGSVITLLGLVSLVLHAANAGLANPSSIPALAAWLKANPLDPQLQTVLFLAVSAGFLVKVPVFPFHTWLPLTYMQAPTAGTIFASGVLAKLGIYGFLRLCIPFFPQACLTVGVPMMGTLAVIGIIYASLCSLAQRDIKRLVAYSSIAHLGFCMLGLFALNAEGLAGGVLQMVNHGLSTAALFLLVAMIYERYQTRNIDQLGGIASQLPLLSCTLVFISMASIGLPGLNGFTGEFLSLAGMFARHPVYAVLGATGVILGAWYLLTMLQHVIFGPAPKSSETAAPVSDLNLREILALAPLAVLCLWIGVYPKSVLDVIEPDVKSLSSLYSNAVQGDAVQQTQFNSDDAGVAPLVSHDLRSVSRVGN
ncbi:complex I subunit 4 family protein [Planctomicrobium sp. SH527]|uniref:complex I subunit 4 family protein n=1 Tax=Planctomicrobium sp. SH527 TaxID=3448123 RepID=UPI003F5C0BF9